MRPLRRATAWIDDPPRWARRTFGPDFRRGAAGAAFVLLVVAACAGGPPAPVVVAPPGPPPNALVRPGWPYDQPVPQLGSSAHTYCLDPAGSKVRVFANGGSGYNSYALAMLDVRGRPPGDTWWCP